MAFNSMWFVIIVVLAHVRSMKGFLSLHLPQVAPLFGMLSVSLRLLGCCRPMGCRPTS